MSWGVKGRSWAEIQGGKVENDVSSKIGEESKKRGLKMTPQV
jgi:hypothetical protein